MKFDESKHPRDDGGKFTDGNGGEVDSLPSASKIASTIPKKAWENNGYNSPKPSIKLFLDRVKKGQISASETLELGDITEKTRHDIEKLVGHKINATKHVIGATEIAHILKRHGIDGVADHSMSNVSDFERISEVLRNYDTISLSQEKSKFRNSNQEKAPIILYRKTFNDGTQIVAEAITDGHKGLLRIISAYKV